MLRSLGFSLLLTASLAWAGCGRKPCVDPSSEGGGPVVRLDVSLATCNATPEAAITARSKAQKGERVELSAIESQDSNGDALSFQWRMVSTPQNSRARLERENTETTAFTADRGGEYEVELVVNDGELSSPPQLLKIVIGNMLPTAAAGGDFISPLGDQVSLDGSQSSDPDGDQLTYRWSFVKRPSGSFAMIEDATTARPRFTPDVYGTYTLALVVNDGEADSPEDQVRVGGGITGRPPVAEAGGPYNAVLGLSVDLDGSASFDPEGSSLSYAWSVAQEPPMSLDRASFSDTTAVRPNFVPMKEGTYTVQLVVADEFYDSPGDTAQVNVVPGTGLIGDPCAPNGCPTNSICRDGFCIRRGGCGAVSEAGSDNPETHVIELGRTSGTFDFDYETYSQQDRIQVVYEGRTLFDTGCVGAMARQRIQYNGSDSSVTIKVTPNCSGGTGTLWEFNVGCPQ